MQCGLARRTLTFVPYPTAVLHEAADDLALLVRHGYLELKRLSRKTLAASHTAGYLSSVAARATASIVMAENAAP
jgi:hypothetical protein